MNESIIEFLVENLDEDFEGVEHIGAWEGYEVYSPVYSRPLTKGIPFFALAGDDGVRLSEAGEFQDILRAIYVQKCRLEGRGIPDAPDYSILAKDPGWRSVERESLNDGTVLRSLYEGYRNGTPGYDRIALLSCIRDSRFVVVCEVEPLTESFDAETIEVGDVIELKEDAPLKLAVLSDDDGNRYMPIFSSEDQIPESYSCKYNVHIVRDFSGCVEMTRTAGLDILMDPFTDPFVIDESAANAALSMPTRLKEEPE